jgi:PIN domain nuclease of toxin-antitoxin system
VRACVLDTHALLWYLTKPERLGKRAARVLAQVDRGTTRAWIPAIVAVELVLLGEAGRTRVGLVEVEEALRRNPASSLFLWT